MLATPYQALVERRLREFFAGPPETPELPDVATAWLFGSLARGDAHADSDVDIAVLYAYKPVESFDAGTLRLESELERLLRRPVDVVAIESAPVDLVHRVLRDGKLLVDRDRVRRIEFEVRARNEFFDLQPVLHRYRSRQRGWA